MQLLSLCGPLSLPSCAFPSHQFRDIVGLVESLDRMTINSKFLKYKPVVPVETDQRAWWDYAITAVLEEDVRRS